jgi:hypothetical protein
MLNWDYIRTSTPIVRSTHGDNDSTFKVGRDDRNLPDVRYRVSDMLLFTSRVHGKLVFVKSRILVAILPNLLTDLARLLHVLYVRSHGMRRKKHRYSTVQYSTSTVIPALVPVLEHTCPGWNEHRAQATVYN